MICSWKIRTSGSSLAYVTPTLLIYIIGIWQRGVGGVGENRKRGVELCKSLSNLRKFNFANGSVKSGHQKLRLAIINSIRKADHYTITVYILATFSSCFC